MAITVKTKSVYYFDKKPYLNLYAACYAMGKRQLVQEFTSGHDEQGKLKWHWSLLGYMAWADTFKSYETEEEAQKDLEPVFNIRKWQTLKRERAKELFAKYKQLQSEAKTDD